MNVRAAKKDEIMLKVPGSLLCPIFLHYILFYSVLFYEHIKDSNKALISKAILLTSCKNGQKFQLNCALS
jgi:hypothetical protein